MPRMISLCTGLKVAVLGCLLVFCGQPGFAQAPPAQPAPALLSPFNQVEFEPAKREKALVATQEYQAAEAELKANTTLSNNDRQKQRTTNYQAYLKKMEGLLSKGEREKARNILVENDVKGLRAKPALPRFFDQLGLSEEQAAKAKELNLQQRIKTQALYHTGNYSPTDRAEESKYISDEFNRKFNDLLTGDQRTKLAELKKQAAALAAIPVPPLYQKLGLNQTQTDKVKQVLWDRQTKLEALSKDSSLSPEAHQTQTLALNQAADRDALAVLNKEQRIKLEDLLRETNYKMPPFYAQLELTEQQQEKLKEALLWQAHEMSVLNQETALTAEQRQQRSTQINEGIQIRLKALLTPEQVTKLNTLLRERQSKAPEQF